MITHLRHMAKVRPQGSDRQAAQWALDEIERLNDLLTDYHRVKALGRADAAKIEQLRADLDLRNQTALDRKESIGKLEAEIERLGSELALERRRLKTSEDARAGLVGVIERLQAEKIYLWNFMNTWCPSLAVKARREFDGDVQTPIMRAASEAAARVDGWSDAKKDAAERIVKSGAYKPQAGSKED